MSRTVLALVTSLALIGAAGSAVAEPTAATPPPSSAGAPAVAGNNIAVGVFHTLLVGSNGHPGGAGWNGRGQLGDATTEDRDTITSLTGLPDGVVAVEVSGGREHSVVLGSDGVAYSTGSNDYGQLGDYTSNTSRRSTLAPMLGLPAGVKATSVSAGWRHTLVLGSDGVAYATGLNGSGQIGDGTQINRGRLTPMQGLPDGVTATAVATGADHSLVLSSDGTVYSTGNNSVGELGDGSNTNRNTLGPMIMPTGITATAITAGAFDSLVLASDGTVYGTGLNNHGELGNGSGDNRSTLGPMIMPTGITATDLAAGRYHSLILGSDGVVYGTGGDNWGQLGDGGGDDRRTLGPMIMPTGITATAVAAGDAMSLIRGDDGLVYGAGNNQEGQLTSSANLAQRTLALLAGQTWSNLSTPTIRGKARVDSRIRVSKVTWSIPPGTLSYKWIRDGSPIKGATGTTYTPRPRDLGDRVKVRITAEHVGLEPITVTTKAVKIAKGKAPRYIAKRKPVLKGKAKVGKKLRLNHFKARAFSPRPTKVRIQWLRNGKVIKGAHAKRYRIKRADRGKKIRVRIKAMLKGHRPGKVQTKRVRVR